MIIGRDCESAVDTLAERAAAHGQDVGVIDDDDTIAVAPRCRSEARTP